MGSIATGRLQRPWKRFWSTLRTTLSKRSQKPSMQPWKQRCNARHPSHAAGTPHRLQLICTQSLNHPAATAQGGLTSSGHERDTQTRQWAGRIREAGPCLIVQGKCLMWMIAHRLGLGASAVPCIQLTNRKHPRIARHQKQRNALLQIYKRNASQFFHIPADPPSYP